MFFNQIKTAIKISAPIQNIVLFREAFLAAFSSYHVRGLIPFNLKTASAAKFIQTIFVANNNVAPNASVHCAFPRVSPKATAGGIKATATITPTSALETPVVRDRTAAPPAARAKAILA